MSTTTVTGERAFVCISHGPFMKLPGRENAGPEYRAAAEEAKRFIADFAPDLVVMFAPDHMHLLNEVRPPFTGILSGRTLPEFGITELQLSVDVPAAATLFERLVQMDVDLAVGEDVAVDHGMGLTLEQLFDDPTDVPLIPVIVNAIGFPLFPVRRATFVGEQVGRALADVEGRVMFIGTGGLSHNPPFPAPAPGAKRFTQEERDASLATALEYLDADWDRGVIAKMAAGDPAALSGLTQEEMDQRGCGANELRAWAATWAAAGSPTPSVTAYELVEQWITGMGVVFGRAD